MIVRWISLDCTSSTFKQLPKAPSAPELCPSELQKSQAEEAANGRKIWVIWVWNNKQKETVQKNPNDLSGHNFLGLIPFSIFHDLLEVLWRGCCHKVLNKGLSACLPVSVAQAPRGNLRTFRYSETSLASLPQAKQVKVVNRWRCDTLKAKNPLSLMQNLNPR